DRRQYLQRGQIARDQPADALRPAQAIWAAGVIRCAALLALALMLAACGGQAGTPFERGRAAFESGDIRTARVELLNALQQEPNNKAARILQARVQLALGDGEAAEGEIVRPRNAVALELRGELTRGQYGLAAAIPWFDRALEVDPGNVTALLERAATYADMGRMSDMLADARKVNTLTGGHTRAFYLEAVLA